MKYTEVSLYIFSLGKLFPSFDNPLPFSPLLWTARKNAIWGIIENLSQIFLPQRTKNIAKGPLFLGHHYSWCLADEEQAHGHIWMAHYFLQQQSRSRWYYWPSKVQSVGSWKALTRNSFLPHIHHPKGQFSKLFSFSLDFYFWPYILLVVCTALNSLRAFVYVLLLWRVFPVYYS